MNRMMPHMPTLNENYALNPGAEGLLNNYHWQGYWSCPRVVDTTEKYSGLQSARYTKNSSTQPQGAICGQFRAAVKGRFRVGGWFKSVAGTRWEVAVRMYRQASIATGAHASFTATGEWQWAQSLEYDITPLGPLSVYMQCVTPVETPVGTDLWVDDVRIEQVA